MTGIAAIQTRYAGCRFRSRIEARWAVFFDALGIRWEYEPQGFDLDKLMREARHITDARGIEDGEYWPWTTLEEDVTKDPIVCRDPNTGEPFMVNAGLPVYQPAPRVGFYLPDFWLPTQQIWLEIKGARPTPGPAEDRLTAFGLAVALQLVPGRQFVVCFDGIPREGWRVGEEYANQYGPHWDNFWEWNRCRKCGSLDMQFEGRAGRNYCGCKHGDKWDADETVLRAYEDARSARFEHGERGA